MSWFMAYFKRRGAQKKSDGGNLAKVQGSIVLSVSTTQLATVTNAPTAQSAVVTVTNGGPGQLDGPKIGTVTETSGSGWLSAAMTDGQKVTITCDPTGQAVAQHTGTVTVTDTNASNSPQTINVTFAIVSAAPALLSASALSMAVSGTLGVAGPLSASVTLSNAGSGTLAGPAAGTLVFSSGTNWGWVTITGTGPTYTFTAYVGHNEIGAAGAYTMTIPVTDANCSNSLSLVVDVSVNAAALPVTMSVTPAAVSFSATEGGANPTAKTVAITNTGSGTLAGPVASEPVAIAWLAESTSGSANSYTTTLTPTTGALTPAVYSGTVRISDANASNSPIDVPVSFTVTAASPTTRYVAATCALLKFGATSGTFTVSSGFTFPAGYVTTTTVSDRKIRVYVNGAEQAVYIEALEGRHADASVRSVLVQFSYTFTSATPITAQVVIGEVRGTTDISKTTLENTLFGFPNPHPTVTQSTSSGNHAFHKYGYGDAVLLPSDASYLISCELVEPCNTAAHDLALGGKAADYINHFESFSNVAWTDWQSSSFVANAVVDRIYDRTYYDRALSHFAHWIRTANVEYYRRACSYAWNRNMAYYKRSSGWGQSAGWAGDPYHMFPEGQLLHYWMTGDPYAGPVSGAILYMNKWWLGSVAWDTQLGSQANAYQDARGLAHSLMGLICAYRAGLTTITSSQDGLVKTVTTKLESHLDKALGTNVYQSDPCYSSTATMTGVWDAGNVNACVGKPNPFMFGIMADALVKYYTWYSEDARIPTAVKAAIDWHYDQTLTLAQGGGTGTAYVAASGFGGGGAFRYTFCANEGGIWYTGDPVLNGLFLGAWGWYAGYSANATYQNRADDIRTGAKTYWTAGDLPYTGSKEFNQNYRFTWRYTYDRGL